MHLVAIVIISNKTCWKKKRGTYLTSTPMSLLSVYLIPIENIFSKHIIIIYQISLIDIYIYLIERWYMYLSVFDTFFLVLEVVNLSFFIFVYVKFTKYN